MAVAFVPVVFPVKRLQIGKVVSPPFRNGEDVIDLPTESRSFAVVEPINRRSAGIFAKGAEAGFQRSFVPDETDHLMREFPAVRHGARFSARRCRFRMCRGHTTRKVRTPL